jgi:glycosyltransferase involved in cell wall biosynthesis
MKCLVITSEYPPSIGGVGNAAAAFSRELSARGWVIEIITVATHGQASREKVTEGIIHRLPLNGDASFWNRSSGAFAEFEALIADFSPDVAVIHGWQGWCTRAVPRLHSANIPVVLQSHGFGMHRVPWHWRPPFGLKAWAGYLPFILRLPSFIGKLYALSVLSKEPRILKGFDHWVGSRFRCQNVVTIPNGVKKIQSSPLEFLETCPLALDKHIVLCVANYCDRKNQLLALDVARQTEKENIFFAFIGGEQNAYYRELEKRTQAWGLERRVALFHGVSRSFTESAIQACDIALMTSKWEMQPLFLLEAMSTGKPWVSTNVGSVSELRGGIISKVSTKDVTSNLLRLLNETKLRKQLGKEGASQWVTEFSTDMVYDRWQALLLSAISKTHQ